MKDFFELATKRESCRNYDEEKAVDNELIMKCIDTARFSPSACNSQPWSFIIENGSKKREEFLECIQINGMNLFTERCPAFIVVVEEEAMLISGKRWEMEADQKYADFDIGFAVAHICFSAVELGLGTCIMGSMDREKLQKVLGIDESKNIKVVIAIGYPAKDTLRKKTRKSLEEIVKII
jgi:nitroreductase